MQRATLKFGRARACLARWPGLGLRLAIGAVLWSPAGQTAAGETAASVAYREAQARRVAEPEEVRHAWVLGRACFDLAEFATNHTQRAALAREGIAACQDALALCATSAPAHYYLGMNRGQLARTMTLGALKLVSAMEEDFLQALALDPALDYAGPDRSLGLLYHHAPGWPVSLGNQTKARQRLEKAVERAPLYPGNRLDLMEAYWTWGEVDRLRQALRSWEKHLDQARATFAGERWSADWKDWEERLRRLEAGLRGTPRETPAQAESEGSPPQKLALPHPPP